MQRVRILVADLPGMLAEILRAVAEREPGLEVIEDPEAAFDLAGAVERAGVDVVVVGGNCDDAAPALALLHARPRLRVVTVSGDGRLACHDALVPHRVVLRDVSPRGLLDAIRGAPCATPDDGPRRSASS